jgi:hypothetical protein
MGSASQDSSCEAEPVSKEKPEEPFGDDSPGPNRAIRRQLRPCNIKATCGGAPTTREIVVTTHAVKQNKPDAIESVHLAPDDKALMVSLVDRDPEVVSFAKAGGLGDDPVAATKRLLRIGVQAAATGSAQSTIGELYRAVDQIAAMPEQVAGQLREAFGAELCRVVGDDEQPGALGAALDSVTRSAASSFAAVVKPVQDALLGSGPAALPQLLETRLSEALTREARKAVAALFDVDGGSPLMTHLANGEKAINGLRKDHAGVEDRLRTHITSLISELTQKVVAQEAQKPTPVQAGNSWEGDALDDIARVTTILGDSVEAVGSSAGHAGSRAGDHLLHVCDESVDGIRVAVECRTGSSRKLTVDLMRQVVVNRDAHAGLLLAQTPDALPRDARTTGFRVYLAERIVVLHYDRNGAAADQQLAVAVQVARMLAKLAATSSGTLAERDQIRESMARIESALNHLRPLRAAVTGIEKETGVVHKHASELEAQIRRVLIEVAALIAA